MRSQSLESLETQRQSEMGQYFTPYVVAEKMAKMFCHFPEEMHLLDAGAGTGILSAAFIETAISATKPPASIRITAYELDELLIPSLVETLQACKYFSEQCDIDLEYQVKQKDFIADSVQVITGRHSLFKTNQPEYSHVIMNPPYKKINSGSLTRRLLSSANIETTNLYSAFLWLALQQMTTSGEMVAIVPRSFCNGPYYKPFRKALLNSATIQKVHIYESRDKAFTEGNVLQENIIFHASKTSERQNVLITSSKDPSDEDIILREVNYDQFVHPDDPEQFIRIIPDQTSQDINFLYNKLTNSLADLGLSVSTGKVVDFRCAHLLRTLPDSEIIPLIYPHNLHAGYVVWPKANAKKPSALAGSQQTNGLLVSAAFYVLVKRFSSKEERRRISAAVYDPKQIPGLRVGFENHINYFYRKYGHLSPELAKGLTLFLNSTLVDQFFRQFSGHTQVNVSDLRSLKYPTEEQLVALGRQVGDEFPPQDDIDRMIEQELALDTENESLEIDNPIHAKKKIKEALHILQMLNVPKVQQNDRSALVLLALANIKPNSAWDTASENLIGITEMMDYFRDYYGINYAPNTRETVRRQTIHQFAQMGLVIANPDDITRPINSPKTRYVLEASTLQLLKCYSTQHWEGNLRAYLREASSLNSLQVGERPIPMIPVALPDGNNLFLSSGGQNTLIKKIVEEFCPRFTPGGKIVYIGDAGQKLTETEWGYFSRLGLNLDRHGKMPDVIIDVPDRKWLVIVEAVTSHGPIDLNRHNELQSLFKLEGYGLVFVTAFETRRAMHKFLSVIAWETEVWVAESPSHLIHFNGDKFLGPYQNSE